MAILIEIGSTIHKLYFEFKKREREQVVESGPGYKASIKRRTITTTAYLESNGVTISGKAVCDEHDVFTKEQGRVIAMKDLLKDLDKEARTFIWYKYHGRKSSNHLKDLIAVLAAVEHVQGLTQGTLTNHILISKD